MAETQAQDLTPKTVPLVETKYRTIKTQFPVPESLPILDDLRKFEPRSMSGQPPVIWDKAQGCQVYDRWGNKWLDWSSGVLVTNAGHNHPKIKQAMLDQINQGMVHCYCFPHEGRARLTKKLAEVAPEGLDKVFLLTTGSEATECAVKLARTQGKKLGGTDKITIVTFENAFHGRTLGAQLAGGIPALKDWIVNQDKNIVQVPFPCGFRGPDTSFEGFLKALAAQNVDPKQVAGVMTETYQGGNSSFAPPEYMQKLRAWCDENQAALICDEVQAGFGRTGTYWGFEHYGITPDLICCGKGISSGMPLSAVIGRNEIMDLYAPGSMTSTHTGNPVCVAAALASLEVIEEEKMVENAAKLGEEILQPTLREMWKKYEKNIGMVHGKGFVAALHMVQPGGIEPDPKTASDIVNACVGKGLLMFAPVGYAGASVKISPPLIMTEEQLRESLSVLEEALAEILG